jgi:DNA-damage-inducible protein J
VADSRINIRLDEGLKRQFEKTLDDMGLNITAGITIFAKAVVRTGKIPFEVTTDPFYSETNQAHLRRAIAQLDAGEGKFHDLIEVDDV